MPDGTAAPVIFSAHGVAEIGARGRRAARSLRHRRDLPAGHEGASRGGAPSPARPPYRPDRPCRPSRGRRARWASCRRARSRSSRRSADVASARAPPDADNLAYVTQTTLSVDDTREIVEALDRPVSRTIVGPHKEDICYATTNRQEAVKRVAPLVDAMIVVGSPNSSNSQRLREVAERAGCPVARLVLRADDIDWTAVRSIRRLGITAGASAPEVAGRGDHRRLRRALRGRPSRTSRRPTRACSSRCRASCAARRRSSPRGGLHGGCRRGARRLPRRLRHRHAAVLQGHRRGRRELATILLHTDAGSYILTLYEKRVRRGGPAVLPRPDASISPVAA